MSKFHECINSIILNVFTEDFVSAYGLTVDDYIMVYKDDDNGSYVSVHICVYIYIYILCVCVCVWLFACVEIYVYMSFFRICTHEN